MRIRGFEPEENRAEAKVEEGDAALAVAGGEEEVGGGGLVGEEVAAKGLRGPPDGGDEGREEGGGGGGHGEDGDELHGVGVDDGDAASGGEGEEVGVAEVGGSAVVAAGRAGEHAVP